MTHVWRPARAAAIDILKEKLDAVQGDIDTQPEGAMAM
jgi:hypothetical protein